MVQKILIQATVLFPQTFQLEVEDGLTHKEIAEILKDHASYLMETSPSEPIIKEWFKPQRKNS